MNVNEDELRQQIRDEEQLKLLSLGYRVSAAIVGFYALFGLLYVFIGLLFVLAPMDFSASGGEPAPALMGWLFGGMGLAFLVAGLTLAALKWVAANRIRDRRSLAFCQVIAAVSCVEIPYGTLLGVLTFVVASRPSIRQQFS